MTIEPPEKRLSAPKWWSRVLVIIILFVAATWASLTIRLDTDLLALLPQDLPSVRGLERFSRQFASDRAVIIVADEAMPAALREEAFRKLKPAIAALPGVESVRAPDEEWLKNIPQLAAWIAWNLPPEQFRKITAELQPERVRRKLDELPNRLAGVLNAEDMALQQIDPLNLLQTLRTGGNDGIASLSWQKHTPIAMNITATKPLIAFQDSVDFCDAIERVVRATLPGESRLYLTGRPAFTAEITKQMRHDMLLMIAVAAVLSSAAFWAFYRSLKPLGWILLGQFLALGVAILGARLGVGSLNVISMGFGCILLGISMDYSILVYHHYASPIRSDAVAWGRLRRGICFSSVTTAGAFLVLTFASVPGLQQLGFLVAGGLLASALFATWLLPAAWMQKPPRTLPFIQSSSDHVALAMERHGGIILGLAVIVVVIAGFKIDGNLLAIYAPDLNRLQSTSSAAFQGQLILAKQDPRATDAIFLVQAPNWDAVKYAADELVSRFSENGASPFAALIPAPSRQIANRPLWPVGLLPRLRHAFAAAGLGDEWSKSTLAFSETLTQAAAGRSDAFAEIEPILSQLRRQDADGCRVIVRIPGVAENPTPPKGLKVEGAEVMPISWVALKAELNTTSIGDLRLLGGGAFAVIVLLCSLAQRSARLVMLNIAALVIALLLLVALLALTGTKFSALSLICVPLLLGLVVDYSLHVLMTLEYDNGDMHKLYAHIGAPILLTGIASCIGFGAPMLTSQPALQNFGFIMDLGIISAVFTCLFLLPILSKLTIRRQRPSR